MLTEKQIIEIREHLERAQKPIFLYDNDVDGLCSYVLLRRYLDRGKGIAVKSHPDVDEGYAKKAQELGADYIFVLDRPILGEKFVEEVKNLQLPLVWIDHHDIDEEKLDYENLWIYNPTKGKNESEEPVTYWSYKVSGKKEDVWIALMGCVADHHYPDFSEDFIERYSNYWFLNDKGSEDPFSVYYGTEIGNLARALSFGLKDSISHVVQLQNLLISSKNPAELILELEGYKPFGKKYRQIKNKYDVLIGKAKQEVKEKMLFFNYGGDMSISSDIANELSYLFPNKIIVVAYSSGPIANMSLRGKNINKILQSLLPRFENASGGGHMDAVGARIQSQDLENFKKAIEQEINKR